MPALSTSLTNETESHPLDLMEQVMGLYEWEFERLGPSEMPPRPPDNGATIPCISRGPMNSRPCT